MAQPQAAFLRQVGAAAGVPTLDPVRLEQFLLIAGSLLETTTDPQALPERLAQAVALFLGVGGAAVGVVEQGEYRVLATHGSCADPGAVRGRLPRDVGTGQAAPPPFVLPEAEGRRTIVLPFRRGELVGALHLWLDPSEMLPDAALALARALAVLAGVALANAEQCRNLAELARLKGDALAAMAHDLRAPLNALVGYASLLAEGALGPLTEEQRRVCATLERQSVEVVDLLGATLDVARLESGRLPIALEEFVLAEVIEGLGAGTFARPRHEGRLRWTLADDLPRLRSDRVKVKQILQNLLDNALRHGGDAPVTLEAAPLPGRAAVRITVRDLGPGIDAAVLAHLFEPFRPGTRNGTGFGLYLVRRLADALGGRVTAENVPGEGAAFTVELPVDPPRVS